MRAPAFWSPDEASPLAWLLTPLGWLYGLAVRLRFATATPAQCPVPIICVGNFVAGGAGKTPTALALAAMLKARGHRPVFLTRGHGGRLAGPVLVTPRHTARDVGDEALLLTRVAPTIISRDRAAGAGLAQRSDTTVIIMDDGLQNPGLHKDFSLAVIDADYGLGNGKVLPAGPLRAAPGFQLGLVQALVIVGAGEHAEQVSALARRRGIPVFTAQLEPQDADWVKGRRLMAFAGIGRPAKFFATVVRLGGDLIAAQGYGDHHVFSEKEAQRLLAAARRRDAVPITTDKDLARLEGYDGVRGELAAASRTISVRMIFDEEERLAGLVEAAMKTT